MPTFFGERYPPTFRGRPPRMAPLDYAIWQRWRPMIERFVLGFYFDVGLGEGKPVPPGTSAELAFMWTRNTQKRADVIADTDNEVWLVELRFAAQSNAIGRLLVYKHLLEKEHAFSKPIVPYLVTDLTDDDVKETALGLGFNYVVV